MLPELAGDAGPTPGPAGWPASAVAMQAGAPAVSAQPFAVSGGMPPAAWDAAVAAPGAYGFPPEVGATPFDGSVVAVRQRPSWMVAALVMVTFGVYWLVWFGQTWAEMKRVVRDPGMRPFWHALTPLAPVYGLFRTHAHFRVMAVLVESHGVPVMVPPRLAVILALMSGVLGWIALLPGVSTAEFVVLMLGALAALARLAARGQTTLNGLWRSGFGAGSRAGARWGEWVALVVCGLVFVLFVLGGLLG